VLEFTVLQFSFKPFLVNDHAMPCLIKADTVTHRKNDESKHSEEPCWKRLAAVLDDWLLFYEAHHGTLSEEVTKAVLSISPAQINRVLAPEKAGVSLRKRRTPEPNAALRKIIPSRPQSRGANPPRSLERPTFSSARIWESESCLAIRHSAKFEASCALLFFSY